MFYRCPFAGVHLYCGDKSEVKSLFLPAGLRDSENKVTIDATIQGSSISMIAEVGQTIDSTDMYVNSWYFSMRHYLLQIHVTLWSRALTPLPTRLHILFSGSSHHSLLQRSIHLPLPSFILFIVIFVSLSRTNFVHNINLTRLNTEMQNTHEFPCGRWIQVWNWNK